MLDDLDLDADIKDPPPIKTIWQSILAIFIAVALGGGFVSLLLIHAVASTLGILVVCAASVAPGMAAGIYVAKEMSSYHFWARMIVGLVVMFSVGVILMEGLVGGMEALHLQMR